MPYEPEDEIGVLWEKESKRGDAYFSGTLDVSGERIDVVVFATKRPKKSPNSPDWRILRSRKREEKQRNGDEQPPV